MLHMTFSMNTNSEMMAYRSFQVSKFEVRGVRKVTTGITGLWQPPLVIDLTSVQRRDCGEGLQEWCRRSGIVRRLRWYPWRYSPRRVIASSAPRLVPWGCRLRHRVSSANRMRIPTNAIGDGCRWRSARRGGWSTIISPIGRVDCDTGGSRRRTLVLECVDPEGIVPWPTWSIWTRHTRHYPISWCGITSPTRGIECPRLGNIVWWAPARQDPKFRILLSTKYWSTNFFELEKNCFIFFKFFLEIL